MGKYLKEFKNDKKFTSKQENKPDSKFKQHLIKSKIIKPESVQKINNKAIFKKFDKYKTVIEQEKTQKQQ